jgi:DNA-binding NarL/FixJ family response regulator
MRLIMVGTPRQRRQLGEQLDAPLDVVGEFDSLDEAREAGIAADAILVPCSRRDRSDDAVALVEPLTTRELTVLDLVAEGLTNKSIAERLQISDQTVKFHLASISGKLGASNRTDAVRRAVRLGLITL